MPYIFVDESGDLGFDFTRKRTSHYFLVTFLMCNDKRPIERVVKKTFNSLPPRERKGHPGILHAVNELPKTRRRLLSKLIEQDVTVLILYLDKKRVYTKLKDEREVLYNFVTNTLLDRIMVKNLIPSSQQITLIASQRETSKFLNSNFKNYLEDNAKRNHKLNLSVEIKTPYQEKGLQAVDFVSWSVFRRIEYKDSTYYDTIKSTVIEESSLYPL
jgi:hypothetical protein